jgi:lipid-A-disaccharide synthase
LSANYTKRIATNDHLRIFLSAGEASGDHYGAEVIAGLRARLPQATFTGLGGTEMETAGQQRVVCAEDVAHMGITEVLRHAPRVYASYRQLVRALERERPALAVLIDFPDVNFRLAKHCKRLQIPVLWFVSPQLWAWKRRRLRWVQERVDRMLVIFPFEEAFYRARGVDAEFVGHPLAAMAMPVETRAEYAKRYGLRLKTQYVDPRRTKHWIALLPGSRLKEVRANLPAMLEAAALLGGNYEFVLPIASTLDRNQLQSCVDEIQRELRRKKVGHGANASITLVRDARAALFHARAAVVASGTATVQALTVGNPFVVVYRVSALTYRIAKRLVKYPAEIPAQVDADGNLPIAMPNLISGRRIVPELINDRFTAENVVAALRPLLEDGPERAKMMADLSETRARLNAGGDEFPPKQSLDGAPGDPIGRVCDAAVELIGGSVGRPGG